MRNPVIKAEYRHSSECDSKRLTKRLINANQITLLLYCQTEYTYGHTQELEFGVKMIECNIYQSVKEKRFPINRKLWNSQVLILWGVNCAVKCLKRLFSIVNDGHFCFYYQTTMSLTEWCTRKKRCTDGNVTESNIILYSYSQTNKPLIAFRLQPITYSLGWKTPYFFKKASATLISDVFFLCLFTITKLASVF